MADGSRRGEHQALYYAVLDYWRRTHAELVLVSAELRAADADALLKTRRALLGRVLSLQRELTLLRTLRGWSRAVMQLGLLHMASRNASALRQERAIVKELEAQLTVTQEAEARHRKELAAEQERWAAERREWEQQQREQERVVTAILESQRSASSTQEVIQDISVANESFAQECGDGAYFTTPAMRQQRPLGACARRLLTAYQTAAT